MATPPYRRQGNPGTYFVLDRTNKEELTRLLVQDQMLTRGMGGVLPEQPDPTQYHRILDVGCGPGGWLIETAQTYPMMTRLLGVDIGTRMIAYARAQAEAQQVNDRVEFHVMDVLRKLDIPDDYVDLVNMRMGGSFLRTWDWSGLLRELRRVTRVGGVIRIVESDVVGESNSPALNHLSRMLVQAFHQAGHFFTPDHNGIISELPHLLKRFDVQNLQTHLHKLEFRAGTFEGQHFSEDMNHVFRTMAPFLQKWGCLPDDYKAICQQARDEMERPNFVAVWSLFVVWGSKIL